MYITETTGRWAGRARGLLRGSRVDRRLVFHFLPWGGVLGCLEPVHGEGASALVLLLAVQRLPCSSPRDRVQGPPRLPVPPGHDLTWTVSGKETTQLRELPGQSSWCGVNRGVMFFFIK